MTLASPEARRRPRRSAPPHAAWLDHVSAGRPAAAAAAPTLRENEVTAWCGRILMFVAFLVTFVGFAPLSHGVAAEGGSLERQLSLLGLAALAAPLVLACWRTALRILARSWPLLLVYAALAATTLWSQFPDVTVRRFAVMVLTFVVALGLAAALPRPRLFLVPFAAAFGVILLIDLALAAVVPGLAYDPLGLAGLHSSKNVAGTVGQAMAITFAGVMLGTRSPLGFWTAALLMLLAFVFLWLTNSKTALGLTVLCVAGLLPLLAAAGRSAAMAVLAGAGVLLAAGAVVFATATLQLSGADWAVITTGDPTFTNRDDIWAAAVAQIERRPYFGYGFGAVWSMLPQFSPLSPHIGFWTDSEPVLRAINQSHNGFLDVMQHGGVVLAAFVALFVVAQIVAVVRRLARPDASRWDVAGNAFYGTLFVSFLFSNLLESSLFFPDALLFTIVLMCSLAHAAWFRPAGQAAGA